MLVQQSNHYIKDGTNTKQHIIKKMIILKFGGTHKIENMWRSQDTNKRWTQTLCPPKTTENRRRNLTKHKSILTSRTVGGLSEGCEEITSCEDPCWQNTNEEGQMKRNDVCILRRFRGDHEMPNEGTSRDDKVGEDITVGEDHKHSRLSLFIRDDWLRPTSADWTL